MMDEQGLIARRDFAALPALQHTLPGYSMKIRKIRIMTTIPCSIAARQPSIEEAPPCSNKT
jgi:hypothetical protein